MLFMKKHVFAGILVGCFLIGGALGFVIPPQDGASESPLPTATENASMPTEIAAEDASDSTPSQGKNADGYYYMVNGKDKLPKLKRLYGEDTVLTLVAQNPETGEELLRIDDVYRANANLNELLSPGTYEIFFYDANGAPLTPSQDVGEILKLK
ncbi:MAG: hypothetical protein AMXMBFR60_22850 [Chloroflexota bacterium]